MQEENQKKDSDLMEGYPGGMPFPPGTGPLERNAAWIGADGKSSRGSKKKDKGSKSEKQDGNMLDESKADNEEPIIPEGGINRLGQNPTLPEILELLDRFVIGQERAKLVLARAGSRHCRRISMHKEGLPCSQIKKSNVLMVGPTGCGKTELARTLAKILGVPFAVTQVTNVTKAGYIGGNVADLFVPLLEAADGDIERASCGILYLDEIDKLACKGENGASRQDPSGEGVQQDLLTILEDADVEVPAAGLSESSLNRKVFLLNTRNIMFVAGGAFVGLAEIIANRSKSNQSSIGFSSALRGQEGNMSRFLADVTPEDLYSFGMIPEFVGRFSVRTHLKTLTVDELERILYEPHNSILSQKIRLEAPELELSFTKSALRAIADGAHLSGTGARSLDSIVEETLLPICFNEPKGNRIVTASDVTHRLERIEAIERSLGNRPTAQFPSFIVDD